MTYNAGMRVHWLIPLIVVSTAVAQTLPSSRPATTLRPPASAPVVPPSMPRNIDKALDDVMPLSIEAMPLGSLADMLQKKSMSNMVMNWNALNAAGITKDTTVTLYSRTMTFEQVLKTLAEALPADKSRANYVVGENTVEITTNSQIGQENAGHMYDLGRALSYSFNVPATHDDQANNMLMLAAIMRAELTRAGEPLDAKGHDLSVKDGILIATCSERGQAVLNRMFNMFNQPIKAGQMAGGTQVTAWAQRAIDAYNAVLAKPDAGVDAATWKRTAPVAIAKNPGKYMQFNMALLPGTKEELAKDKPEMAASVSDVGALLIGPKPAIAARTVLVVYDLRDVMKKIATKSKMTPPPDPNDVQRAILTVLQTSITPEAADGWGTGDDLGKKPAILIPYNGLLVTFATAETHRGIVKALQDMNK